MKIPSNSFDREYLFFKDDVQSAINRVLESGWYILGKECDSFEKELSTFMNVPYCVTVANGTDAISLALRAHGIGQGDEVITTSMTAYPTIVGIVETGAVPILVDIDKMTGLIDISKIESAITSKTKALMPVHMYGQSCDMTAIVEITRKNKLILIEDCAQSIGAKWKDKMTGSFGESAALSFYPTKNLGAYGDGGAVVTKNEAVYEKLKKLRNYGQSKRYYHEVLGINSRLDELQAAILRVKLIQLEKRIERRRQIAKYYDNNIISVTHIKEERNAYHTYHLYVVSCGNREGLMKYLESKGIETLIHYPVPIHRQKAFRQGKEYILPVVEKYTNEVLSIPMYPELTDTEVKYIVDTINNFV